MQQTKHYGWKPDLPDHRDLAFKIEAPITLPPHVDLSVGFSAPYDQGQLGSCTANAISGAFEFELGKQGLKDFMPARLFIYYNERSMEGTVGQDAGAQIRDGIKSINKQGVCHETLCPYNITAFTIKPTTNAYTDALKNKATSYMRLDNTNINQLKSCIAAGYPFVFGFTVYTSFESQTVANTGVLKLPTKSEKVLGGHAVCAVGYDDATSTFLVRNSWGTGWGKKGYFTMPYAYITNTNLADDFWTLRIVTES